MTTGIWLLLYDIAAADRDHYVEWFHRCHVPEKLARPGYRWAAHFEAPPPSGDSDLYRYIGMFGGVSTKVFLDPSPAELKLTQSSDTRAMIALRQNPSTAILAHEWSWQAPRTSNTRPASGALDAIMNAPQIKLLTIEASAHEETVGSLCAQKLEPQFAANKAAIACHKMTNVMGMPRHMMLFEVADILSAGAGSNKVVVPFDLLAFEELGDAVQMETRNGRRIWPV